MSNQNERNESSPELLERVRRLEQADRRKDQFLRELAHELGNVLLPVQLALEILKHPDTDQTTVDQVREILQEQVPYITRVITELRNVSKVCRGNVELQKRDVDFAAVVSQAVEAAGPLIEARQHRLAVSLPDEPIRLKGDPSRLEQMIAELLQNAARFTEPGGSIELAAACQDGEVVVRVRDSGIGIEPELLPDVFELFVHGAAPGRPEKNLGVGLALVRTLAELHGGTVTAESAGAGAGRGSEFTVRLPNQAERAVSG